MSIQLRWDWANIDMGLENPTATDAGLFGMKIPILEKSRFDNELSFLNEGEPITTPLTYSHDENVQKIIQISTEYPLSPDFIRVLTSNELMEKIISASGNYFSLDEPVYIPEVEMTVLLFYHDQQDCVLWYLILDGQYEGHVLASTMNVENADIDEEGPEAVIRFWNEEVVLCSPTFSEFVYRMWVENQIWFHLNQKMVLTPFVKQECDWYEAKNRELGRTCR